MFEAWPLAPGLPRGIRTTSERRSSVAPCLGQSTNHTRLILSLTSFAVSTHVLGGKPWPGIFNPPALECSHLPINDYARISMWDYTDAISPDTSKSLRVRIGRSWRTPAPGALHCHRPTGARRCGICVQLRWSTADTQQRCRALWLGPSVSTTRNDAARKNGPEIQRMAPPPEDSPHFTPISEASVPPVCTIEGARGG